MRQELLPLRDDLIAKGLLPDLQALDRFSIKDMQATLSSGQVLLAGIVPQVYGITDQLSPALDKLIVPQAYGIDKPPMLLAICPKDTGTNNAEPRIEKLPIPLAVGAYQAFTDLGWHMARKTGNKGMRDAGCSTVTDKKPAREESQARDDLLENMGTLWDSVLNELKRLNLECREIRLVTHGILHTLPWQGTCPNTELSVKVYPGLYSYWQNSQHASTTQALRPSQKLKLRVLASDAADDPLWRLYFVEAERLIIKAIWGDAVEAATDFEPSADGDTIPTIMLLSGHGDIKNGFVLKADRDAPKYLSQSELLRSRHALQGLIASACLLGSSTDQDHEPVGFLAAARARKNLRFACGALLPIGDFAACLLSLLFHTQWKNDSSPDQAMAMALKQLETGVWPEKAKEVFKEVFTEYLPELVTDIGLDREKALKIDRRTPFDTRKANILESIHCHDGRCIQRLDALMKSKENAAQDFVNYFCDDPEYLKKLGRSLKQDFIPFWIWG